MLYIGENHIQNISLVLLEVLKDNSTIVQTIIVWITLVYAPNTIEHMTRLVWGSVFFGKSIWGDLRVLGEHHIPAYPHYIWVSETMFSNVCLKRNVGYVMIFVFIVQLNTCLVCYFSHSIGICSDLSNFSQILVYFFHYTILVFDLQHMYALHVL
jgi:hypothetical protein